jgi:para-nitrobenzyl esterase
MTNPIAQPSRRVLLGLLAAPLLARAAAASEPAVEVTTRSGTLAGTQQDGVRSFRGIPYAAPPVGKLRFRPPAPVAPWSGVRPALAFAPAAIQPPAPDAPGLPTSEDCLYLNVWAPAEGTGHPVFVWLHGGGNTAGTTQSRLLDGTSFARDGVVCVTVGYRLGAFGFLDLGAVLGPDYAGSGCNGLRDQAQALAWVRDNIAAFGGDPARVTLGGQSAGAKDVCALLAAPSATPLFQRAIVESGSGQTVFTPAEGEKVARRFAAAAGASPLDLPAARILAAEQAVLADSPVDFPFRPVMDQAFLPRRPVDAVAGGSAANIPLLLGSAADESVLFLPDPAKAAQDIPPSLLSNLPADAFAAQAAPYAATLPELSAAERHWRMLTAEEYWIPTLRMAEAQVDAGGSAWMYRFDVPAESGPYAGHAVHASELPSVWDRPGAALPVMHAAWVRFIAGNPPGADGLPHWPHFDTGERQTMIFDAKPHVAADPRGDERRLWLGKL